MSQFAVMDDNGIIETSNHCIEELLNKEEELRETNEVKGDLVFVEILHRSN